MHSRNLSMKFLLSLATVLLPLASLAAQTQYSIGSPTNDEQYMLELINRARANGGAEATRLGLSGLQEGPPSINGQTWTIQNTVQPLSWNPRLQAAAQGQAVKLNNADQFFLGVSPHTFGGTDPGQRISAAGYSAANYNGPTTASGYYPGQENVFEEVSGGGGAYTGTRLTMAVLDGHNSLFTDQTVPGRGHRQTTMLAFFREIGIGISVGTDNQANPGQPNGSFNSIYVVQDFGTRTSSTPFVTGVVFNDLNNNGFYDPGEGVGGVHVTIAGGNYFAVTSSSGGYSIPVDGNGTYNITFKGAGVPATMRNVTVAGSQNAKLDLTTSAVPTPTLLSNISTRLSVGTNDNVLIGGFIVSGTESKRILIRAIGPSLNLAGKLANPTLELHDKSGATIESNDDWQKSPNAQAISDTTIPPSNSLESAIIRTVNPGPYTAIVRGKNNTTGVALVEIYDLGASSTSQLANISTRGLVLTGDNVLIGGTIVAGTGSQKVIVRALGPSLSVPGKLSDPTLELRNSNGALVASNDNWVSSPQKAEIMATTIPPPNDMESAIVATLPHGAYTAIVRGAGNKTGVALVDFYTLK